MGAFDYLIPHDQSGTQPSPAVPQAPSDNAPAPDLSGNAFADLIPKDNNPHPGAGAPTPDMSWSKTMTSPLLNIVTSIPEGLKVGPENETAAFRTATQAFIAKLIASKGDLGQAEDTFHQVYQSELNNKNRPQMDLKTMGDTAASLAQGATLGWAPKIEAGVEAGLGHGTYGENAARNEAYMGGIPESINLPGNIIGGAATGGLTGKLATKGIAAAAEKFAPNISRFGFVRAIGRIIGGGLITGTEGGIAGAGYAPHGKEKTGALVGATLGLGAGITIPALIEGYRLKQGMVGADPATTGLSLLDDFMTADDLTPARRMPLLKAQGNGGTVAQIGGSKTRSLIREAVQMSKIGDRFSRALDRTQAGSGQRIIAVARNVMGAKRGAFDTIDQLIRHQATKARPLYQKAYSTPLKSTEDLQQMMSRSKTLRQAWDHAAELIDRAKAGAQARLAEGPPTLEDHRILNMPDMYLESPSVSGKGGISNKVIGPSPKAMAETQVWDYVKRALDHQIDSSYSLPKNSNSGIAQPTPETRSLARLKGDMLRQVDRQNSAFAEARKTFAGDSELMSAVNKGRNFLKGNLDLNVRDIKDMSPQELEYFRIGVADAVKDNVESGLTTGDAGKKIFGSMSKQKRLLAAFPNFNAYKQFRRAIVAEAKRTTLRRVTPAEAGSPTNPREAGIAGALPNAIAEAAVGGRVSAVKSLLYSQKRVLSPDQADAILKAVGWSRPAEETINRLNKLNAYKKLPSSLQTAINGAIISGTAAGATRKPKPKFGSSF